MTLRIAIVYIAQHKAAAKANKSPVGLNSRLSPFPRIIQATPSIAIPEPTITPDLIFCLKTIAISKVVKSGEIDANRDTLPALVSCKAIFSVMKYSEPEHMPLIRKVNSSLHESENIFFKVKSNNRKYAPVKRYTYISTGVKPPDSINTLVLRKEVAQNVTVSNAPICAT